MRLLKNCSVHDMQWQLKLWDISFWGLYSSWDKTKTGLECTSKFQPSPASKWEEKECFPYHDRPNPAQPSP